MSALLALVLAGGLEVPAPVEALVKQFVKQHPALAVECGPPPIPALGLPNGCVLTGDFDGDGKVDAALKVVNAAKKSGVALVFAARRPLIAGAGVKLGSGGDSFEWMDAWAVRPKLIAPTGSKGDALWVGKAEAAGGVIGFDGKALRWTQEGD